VDPVVVVTGEVAPELVAATSFRHVLLWLLDRGITTPEAIIAKCEELRPHVPAISRLPADITDRVNRALVILVAERAGTSAA
jgi:hypothetical protein